MSLGPLYHSAMALPTGLAAHPVDALPARNVILVHGALVDERGWRGIYERLVAKGLKVTIVKKPNISLGDDVKALHRVIEQVDGPVVLVGESYGGQIITVAGVHPLRPPCASQPSTRRAMRQALRRGTRQRGISRPSDAKAGRPRRGRPKHRPVGVFHMAVDKVRIAEAGLVASAFAAIRTADENPRKPASRSHPDPIETRAPLDRTIPTDGIQIAWRSHERNAPRLGPRRFGVDPGGRVTSDAGSPTRSSR